MSESPYQAHDTISRLLKDRAHHLIDESELIAALLKREDQAKADGRREVAKLAIGFCPNAYANVTGGQACRCLHCRKLQEYVTPSQDGGKDE